MKPIPTNTDAAGQGAHPDLRGWLQWLAATDRLAVARKGISLIDELAAVAKKLENERAVLFPAPGQHAIPVVANLFADRSWIADSLGVPPGELLSRFQNAVRHPLPWVEVMAAPVHDVVHRKVDLLAQLPIPKHNEHDSGPYITAALLIARNPKTGIQNVSIHRCQVSGPDRIGVLRSVSQVENRQVRSFPSGVTRTRLQAPQKGSVTLAIMPISPCPSLKR